MNWSIPLLISQGIALAAFTGAYGYLFLRWRQLELGLWAGAWALCAARTLCVLIGTQVSPVPGLDIIALASVLGSAFFLLAGAWAFVLRPLPPFAYLFLILPVAWASAARLAWNQSLAAVGSIYLLTALVLVYAAYYVLRHAPTAPRSAGAFVLACSFLIWAIVLVLEPAIVFHLIDRKGLAMVGVYLSHVTALVVPLMVLVIYTAEAQMRSRVQSADLNTLNLLAMELSGVLKPEAVLNQALAKLPVLLGTTGEGLAFLRDTASQVLAFSAQHRFAAWSVATCTEYASARLDREKVHNDVIVMLDGAGRQDRAAHLPASHVIVPLVVSERLSGALLLVLPNRAGLLPEKRQLLIAVGRLIETALNNALLHQAQAEQLSRVEALVRASRRIAEDLDRQSVLESAAEAAMELTGAARAGIYLVSTVEPGRLTLAYHKGLPETFVKAAGTWVVTQPGACSVPHDQLLWLRDVQTEPRTESLREIARAAGVHACLVLPLIYREHQTGVIVLCHDDVRPYTPSDLQLTQTLADKVATALENVRLFNETRRRAVHLQAASEVARDATVLLDVDQLLTQTVERVRERFGFYHAGVFLVDEDGDYAVLRAVSGPASETMLAQRHRLRVGQQGMVGYVTGTGHPRIALDVGKDAVHFVNPLLPKTRSEMALPLKSRGRIIGALDVQSTEEAAFSADDVATLQIMADQLAKAIENSQLYAETTRRLVETRAMRAVMEAAASTLDFNQVLEKAARSLSGALNIEHVSFMLPTEDGAELTMHTSLVPTQPPSEAPCRVSLGSSIAGRAYRRGRAVLVPDLAQSSEFQAGLLGARSELAVPIYSGNQVVAVMDVGSSRPGTFVEDDVRFFSAVAAQLAVQLENARLYQEMTEHAVEMRLLAEASKQMASLLDVEAISEHLADVLVQRFGGACLVLATSANQDQLTVSGGRAAANCTLPLEVGQQVLLNEHNSLRRLCQRRQLTYIPDLGVEDWDQALVLQPGVSLATLGYPAGLLVPLFGREQWLGLVLMALQQPLEAPMADHLDWIQALANQAVTAIANAQLYQELERQAQELMDAYASLQEIDRLRSELVQNVGHELRTPLSLIRGYAELLFCGDLGPIDERQRHALQVIRERVATLSRLIHNLTVLQNGPLPLLSRAPASVLEMVHHALEEFEFSALRHSVRVEEHVPRDLPLVFVDQERMELVLAHLIDNAIKFSPGGGVVSIDADAGDVSVRVRVQDSGIGISPENMRRIFDRFYQVDGSTRRRFGGMGVGLALVWEIVEAHGGSVSIESVPDQGSCFEITLPVSTALPVNTSSAAVGDPAWKKEAA